MDIWVVLVLPAREVDSLWYTQESAISRADHLHFMGADGVEVISLPVET